LTRSADEDSRHYPRRMLRTGTIALATLLLAAGCSGGAPPNAQEQSKEPSKSQEPKYAALTKAQAKKSLLELSDMPTGFSQDRSGQKGSEVTYKSGDPACKDFVDGVYGGRDAKVDVRRLFMEDVLGPVVHSSIAVREESDAKARMDKVAASLNACERFIDGEDNSKMKVSPVSFPKLGEQSVAYRLAGSSPDFDYTLTLVSVRLGGNTVHVGDGGLSGGVGAKKFERLARTAVARAESAARN